MTGAVFVDVEKAFDRVQHNGILFKLVEKNAPEYLGRWIQNYLKNRTFQVRVGTTYSDTKYIKAGVPQGSVLGPTLFNIFFNDILDDLDTTENALFADYLANWKTSPYIQIINKRLQTFLDNLDEWIYGWRFFYVTHLQFLFRITKIISRGSWTRV